MTARPKLSELASDKTIYRDLGRDLPTTAPSPNIDCLQEHLAQFSFPPEIDETTRDLKRILDGRRLLVKVISARNLLHAGGGLVRPENNGYVLVTVGEHAYKTKTVFGDVGPTWEHEFVFTLESEDEGRYAPMQLELRNQLGQSPELTDPTLGTISIDINGMKPNRSYTSWYVLALPPGRSRLGPGLYADSEGDVQLAVYLLDLNAMHDEIRREEYERFAVAGHKMLATIDHLERQCDYWKGEATGRSQQQLRGGPIASSFLPLPSSSPLACFPCFSGKQ